MVQKWLTLADKGYTQEDAEWDAFVADHPQGSMLQTTNWARLKSRFGWQAYRVWLRQQGQLVAGAQILFRSAAWGLARLAYIPHGPLVDWRNDEAVEVLLNQIDQAVYAYRAGLVKMEPRLWQRDMPAETWRALCQRHGCLPDVDTVQPPRTLVVDLRPEPEVILARMKQKTRYNIRLAEKKGVTTRLGEASDLNHFIRLMAQTGQRNAFGIHDPDYYRAVYELFAPDQVALWLAEYAGRPLAGVMVFRHGAQAAYLYGASSDEERSRMPTYAVQWAAMLWARAQNCASYDLWGIPDTAEEELEAQFERREDGLWGVYRFKRGFGGDIQRTVGAADRVYNRLVYRLYQRRRGLG